MVHTITPRTNPLTKPAMHTTTMARNIQRHIAVADHHGGAAGQVGAQRRGIGSAQDVERGVRDVAKAAKIALGAVFVAGIAVGGAAVTGVVWTLLGEPEQAVVRVITVLVITCPHALGLAIPLVVAIGDATADAVVAALKVEIAKIDRKSVV